MSRLVAAGFVVLGLVVSSGCATSKRPVSPPPVDGPLIRIPDHQWPTVVDDLDAASFVEACRHGLDYFQSLPDDRIFAFGSEVRTAAELASGLRRAAEIVESTGDGPDRVNALRADFELFRSVGRDGEGEVLVTGYFEPMIPAKRVAEPPFVYPVYGVPDDLLWVDLQAFGVEDDRGKLVGRVEGQELVPYLDRRAIDFGEGLVGPAEVLGYLDDPVNVFFLQVQGSGTLIFPDGERVRAGYATGNGHPYRSIGRLLLDEGAMTVDEMSMQSIHAYLDEHPEELERILSHNPSYVFFQPLPPTGGPLGCFGVPVTAGRSIAVDRRLFPAPTVALLRGRIPSSDGTDPILERLVVVEDTGGAITGPGRVDLFFGAGDEAGELAGRTKHLGELYIFLPKRGAR